jgi:benzoyl-CoA reductase/2-hydroxyglutaryl-CoA dehydratase subunit BcrC/BadD/HgdB
VKTAVYSSPFIPAEWVAAHRFRPARIRPDPVEARGAAGPLTGLCPYARAFIGEALSADRCDAVLMTSSCDQMRRAAEWLTMTGDLPVFLMNVPATWQTPASARIYRDELERLGRFLIRAGGKKPTLAQLSGFLEAYDARRAAFRDSCGTMSPRLASRAAERFDLGEEPEIAEAVAAEPRGVPVALVGGPLMRGDDRVFRAVEEAGGRVVLDGTESGLRTWPAPFDRRRWREDPLLELVDAYFGTIPEIFRRPDTLLFNWLRREPARSGARGIIIWRYVWCDMWAAATARIREDTGLPVLELDVPGDVSEFAQACNRIQAFMEVLK